MSNTIIDALKKKGSTGGNNIMEAIENLPDSGGSGGSSFVKVGEIHSSEETATLQASYNQLITMARAGQIPYIIRSDTANDIARNIVSPLHDLAEAYGDTPYTATFGSYINPFISEDPDENMVESGGK